MSGPLEALRARLPGAFRRGVEQLRARAEGGDAGATARLDDVTGARSAVRLIAEGEGEAWVGVADGELTVSDGPPEGLPVRLAVAVPAEAWHAVFAEVPEGAENDDRAARRLAGSASRRAEQVLEGQRLDFHVVVEGVPELGDVVSRVAVGAQEPPDTPRFTATVRYADLEAAREGGVDPQQFLMGGRVRFAGDYVPALQLGMQLAQVLQQGRPRS